MSLTELPNFASTEMWVSLLTLLFLEIVLGIDNIIFIAITAAKLKKEQRTKATNIGLLLAMVMRIALLFGVTWLMAMNEPFAHIDWGWLKAGLTGQSLILIAGGIFLLYKATTEIHHKLEGPEEKDQKVKLISINSAIFQIFLINAVFSFDSILTAVGMTSGTKGALWVMIFAVIVSVVIMMAFATPVSNFVNKHPSIQMLGMSFLILIGFMLIAEGAHNSHIQVMDQKIGAIPKGYLYFAIAFSLFVEFLNLRLRRKGKAVVLHKPKLNKANELSGDD